ncbi:MAG: Gfo/Idh/MocA family oxidoreductase [Verrucomicrobia bacterium]|nr:Gfo/Idh/MocA family oxidoreductase [Verrucomicrobiota bacterium]
MIGVAVIGCGQWGPNHVRNFTQLGGTTVVGVADLSESRLGAIKSAFPAVETTKDYRGLLGRDEVNAVVVATPTATHYAIVKEALEAGKDVLCEKPLTLTSAESAELTELAKANGRILMCGHVFLFNAGVRALREYVTSGELGRIHYIHSERTNLGPIRSDVNAVYDLASHDISICSYLLASHPVSAVARGKDFLQKGIEDLAFISLSYPHDVLANIHVSWLNPRKVRTITVVGDKKMAIFNDMDPAEPIRLYNKGVIKENYYTDFAEFKMMLHDSDILIPKIKMGEPLRTQATYFLDCVAKRRIDLSDGAFSTGVVRTLEMVQHSMAEAAAAELAAVGAEPGAARNAGRGARHG